MANLEYISPFVPKYKRKLRTLSLFKRIKVISLAFYGASRASLKFGLPFAAEYVELVEYLAD